MLLLIVIKMMMIECLLNSIPLLTIMCLYSTGEHQDDRGREEGGKGKERKNNRSRGTFFFAGDSLNFDFEQRV